MKTFKLNLIFMALILAMIGLTLTDVEAAIDRNELYSRKSQFTSQSTHKKLVRAMNLLQGGNASKAISLLQKLEAHTRKRPYENAQVRQNLGFAFAQEGKLKQSLLHFNKALELNVLPAGPTLGTLNAVAQIQAGLGQVELALKSINQWFDLAKKPGPEAYALRANLKGRLKQPGAALQDIEKAISLTSEKRKAWHELAAALYYEKKNYDSAANHLRVLVEISPQDKKYWKQLSGMYLMAENHQDALTAFELSHKMGQLEKEKELINLVHLYLMRNIPLKAADVLQEGFESKDLKRSEKNLRLLAQAYVQAEEPEQALQPLAEAASKSKNGKIHIQRGQILLDMENWKEAQSALKSGLKKGGLKSRGRVHLALGIAQMNLGQKSEAKRSLSAALNDKKSRNSAQQWLAYMQAQ